MVSGITVNAQLDLNYLLGSHSNYIPHISGGIQHDSVP